MEVRKTILEIKKKHLEGKKIILEISNWNPSKLSISGDDQLQEHRDFLERLQPNRDGENLSRLALYFQNFLKKVGSLDDLNNYFVQPEEDLR